MVTESNYIKDDVYYGAVKIYGLSDDSKPMSYGNGSIFIEIDSGKNYIFDAENNEWVEKDNDVVFLSDVISESPQEIGELNPLVYGEWVASVIYPQGENVTVEIDESNKVIVTASDYTGNVVVICTKIKL